MRLCYKKLWKILIDRNMYKKDLANAVGLSTVTMTRITKGLGVNTNILMRICKELDVDLFDICEMVRDDEIVTQSNSQEKNTSTPEQKTQVRQ